MGPSYFQRHKKIFVSDCFLILVLIPLFFFSACSNDSDQSLKSVKESGLLRVAMSGDYPPFSFYDEKGDLEGFDVEVAREIANRIGVTFQPVITEWGEKIPGLLAGKFDAILGCVAVDKEELEDIRFTAPYYHSTTQVLVQKDSGIEAPEELENKRVGAVAGTTFEMDARKLGQVHLRLFKSHSEAFHALQNGAMDAVVTDRVVGDNAIKTGKFQLKFLNFTVDKRQVSFGLKKENQALQEKIESILDEMRQDGVLQTYIRKVALCEYDCKIAFQNPR